MNKKKSKITEYSFRIPIFNQKIKVLIGKRSSIEKLFSENDIVLDNLNNADAACFGIDNYLYLWFESNPNLSVMCHEVGHCVYAIIKSRGLDIEDEELFCYLQEFIIDNILKCVKVTLPIVMDPINQRLTQADEHQ